MNGSSNPVVDLSGLSLENQMLEYFDRRKTAQLHPEKATLVTFILARIVRDVVNSVLDDFDIFYLAT